MNYKDIYLKKKNIGHSCKSISMKAFKGFSSNTYLLTLTEFKIFKY